MNRFKTAFSCVLLMVNCQLAIAIYAQEIPIGTWRAHVSFNAVHSISLSTTKVYAASPNGITVLDRQEQSLSAITKLDGLSSTDITQVAVDQPHQQILVAYSDGNLDILRANEIINFDRLKTSTTVTGSKRINHITVNGNFAFLSTDYGVVVFDLVQLEVKETYRDLGSAGEKIKIYQSTFFNDSIFLATEMGVLAGDEDDNLLDFNNWRRFNVGVFSGNIQSITTFNNEVYTAITGSGIYRYENGNWTQETFSGGLQFKNLTARSDLLITEGNALWRLSDPVPVTSDEITSPVIAVEDENGKLWIGDQQNGLVSDYNGSFEKYIPNGPSFSAGLRMRYDVTTNSMHAVSGGYSSGFSALLNQHNVNSFGNGMWSIESSGLDQDLTDVAFSGSRQILSSFGEGIQVIENGAVAFQDETTTPFVTALATSATGVWVANYSALQSLNLLKSDNTWESFSFPSVAAASFPTHIVVDYLGQVWMVLNPGNGGGIVVFNKQTNQSVHLTEVPGAGGLPNRSVYSIATDRNGQVWVGTAQGAAYFPDPSRVFTAGINAVKPIFENRFLLRDEKVTSIEVDGGNRKWMGTERGVWLFDPFGESQVYNFNSSNSPLLSDKITDLEINSMTGEVFFMSDLGIISFRSTATLGEPVFGKVKIFPNPVTAHFNGDVGISGLATDALVKITDVSGKLVWQTQANGGTATWNVRDYTGRRATTGMYLVFATAQDGTESVIGKIAVVD